MHIIIKSEINSHTTTKNRLNATLNDLSTSEKRVANTLINTL